MSAADENTLLVSVWWLTGSNPDMETTTLLCDECLQASAWGDFQLHMKCSKLPFPLSGKMTPLGYCPGRNYSLWSLQIWMHRPVNPEVPVTIPLLTIHPLPINNKETKWYLLFMKPFKIHFPHACQWMAALIKVLFTDLYVVLQCSYQ